MIQQKQKRKRCKICRDYFPLFNSLQMVCGKMACTLEWAGTDAAKKHSKKAKNIATREDKLKLKTKSDWTKDAQIAFNRYIRLRDAKEGCISCGTLRNSTALTGGYWDAGHYRSIGACPELRFEEKNCHKQCKQCNSQLSGNVVEYRLRLIEKIGSEQLEWLEGPHEPKRYTIDDLKQIQTKYKALCKELEGKG